MKVGQAVHGTRSAGAPFNVYLRNVTADPSPGVKRMHCATFAVKPGDTLERNFPLSLFAGGDRYALDVHAPNGFYRSFEGPFAEPVLYAAVDYEKDGASLTGNVQVALENTSEQPFVVSIEDRSYGQNPVTKQLAAGQRTSIIIDLTRSHNWYDFSVNVSAAGYSGRFAGRVETGRSSFSDPLMGASPLSIRG